MFLFKFKHFCYFYKNFIIFYDTNKVVYSC